MPMKKALYPPNWNAIATAVKEAAGWKCEECGLEHDCYIVRSQGNPSQWRFATDEEMEDERFAFLYITHVVMTVHHIGVDKPDGTPGDPNDKMDCRAENLICLCQKCHLDADRAGHLNKSSQTRIHNKRQAQLEAGQGELF